jgi:SH3 domain-containing YSC84-like protein 1
MKALVIGILVLATGLSAQAITRGELDRRVEKLAMKFTELQDNPATRIPPDLLRRAVGIVLVQTSRGGFIFGYQGGYGVMMVREPNSAQWSAPVFLTSNEGTFGAQIGGQTSFKAILLMNTNAVPLLTGANYAFSSELRGTAGDLSSSQQNNASPLEQMTLVFGDSQGLYGGAIVKGGGLAPDSNADAIYYGQYLTPSDILFGNRVRPTEASNYLASKLNQAMR